MVLSFGARNVFSFKEGFEVNLSLDKNCPSEISHNKSFATVMALKGANASGKTSVLKTLAFLFDFGKRSFNYLKEDEIPFDSYFGNKNPSDMYVVFSDGNDIFKYELEVTTEKVLSESIYKNDALIIERKANEFTYIDEKYQDIKIIKLKDKSSLISTAAQYEVESFLEVFSFFVRNLSNVDFFGLRDEFINYENASKNYYENSNLFEFAKYVITNSDTGIIDILIKEHENIEKKEKEYIPFFKYLIDGKEEYLTYLEQSSGVKSLYAQLLAYQLMLSSGGILILDEFDINLHPDLLPILIDFFDDPEKNVNDAQLIFTTHNAEIMEKLKKYRTVLVNKEDNESFLYRMDELNGEVLRNDRPLTPIYNSGRIGGKPKPTL